MNEQFERMYQNYRQLTGKRKERAKQLIDALSKELDRLLAEQEQEAKQ